MPRNLKADEVEEIVKSIIIERNRRNELGLLLQEDFTNEMKVKWSDFSEKYKELFSQAVEGILEPVMFNYMLNMLRQIDGGDVSEHAASVKVGEVLVDKYVKPLIDEEGK